MSEIIDLVEISKYAGERIDLVQAGGGNSSVKFDNGEMIIKASGYSLSEVLEDSGYSKVVTKQISDIVNNKEIINAKSKRKREKVASELVKLATIDPLNRPSIETLLHSFLLKYTLHTHPIAVNIIAAQKGWKKTLLSIFPQDEIAFVEYQTPGVELALVLDIELKEFNSIPKIVILQNHGLIITTNTKEEIYTLTEHVIEKIETYLKLDLSKYKLTTQITKAIHRIEKSQTISYLSEDRFLNTTLNENKELFFKPPFCPDSLVYCGIGAVEIHKLTDSRSIQDYKEKYYVTPIIIIYQNNLFIVSQSVKKAKEIEDVLKFQIMVLAHNNLNIEFLAPEELAYLSNWEAEKFRQKL
jgi:rhamnose utilization protein RhaD (predicted bifunctional aldolase and dehydrogenase)